LVLMALTTLSLMFQSGVITLVIAQLTTDTSTARCTPMTIYRHVLGPKTGITKRIMMLLVRRLHLQLCQWLDKFTPSFLIQGWFLADRDKPTRNYYALISAEEKIGSEAFTWSRARTFSFYKNSIGKVIAYATATNLHHSPAEK